MSIASIKAGGAFYEIFAKDKTSAGLSSAEQKLMRFGTKIGLIGTAMAGFAAASLTGIGAMVKGFASAGDDIADAMATTGLGSDFLQSLKFAAADAGVEFNALQGAVGKMSSLFSDAAGGSDSAKAKLAALGLTVEQLAGMNQEERFAAFADAISKIQDPAKQAAAAIDVFGKSGQKLLPILQGGAAGLKAMVAEMKNRGLVLSPEQIALAAKANGAFLLLSASIKHIANLIGAAAAPAFIAVLDVVQQVVEAVARFINNNSRLIAGMTIGLGVIGAVGAVLMAVGAAAIALALATTGLTAAISALGTAIAVIASPVFLITAAIVACGAAALVAAYHLDQLFNGGAALDFLKDAALGAWEAMKLLWTAASNGRWDLAGQLIGNGLTVGFRGAILTMKEMWNGFTDWLLDSITNSMRFLIGRVNAAAQSVGLEGFDIGFLDKAKTMARAGLQLDLGPDTAKFAQSAAELTKTIAEIQKVGADAKAKRTEQAAKMDLGNVSDQMRQSSLMSGSAGAFSSAGAAILGRAAPANITAEKQLEVLQNIDKGVGKVQDACEDFQALTAD